MTRADEIDKQKELESKFPSSQRIQAVPMRGAEIASMRLVKPRRQIGSDAPSMHSIGWVPDFNCDILDRRLDIARKNIFDRNDPADMARYIKLAQEAANFPGSNAARELAAYRTFEITSDVMASPFALAAFQNINLSAEELPAIITPRSRNLQHFTIRSLGQDGGPRMDQVRTTKSFQAYDLDQISTDKIEYPLYDIQQGRVEGLELVNQNLKYDMDMHIDKLAQDNIDSLQTASGLRDLLNIHPLINVNNLPDKNYLDLNGVDAGVMTIDKIKQILNHVAMLGSIPGDGVGESMSMKSFHIAPLHMRDSWDWVDLVSGFSGGEAVEPSQTIPTPMREQIFNSGMFVNAWGYNFSWVPNARMTTGRAYVFFNQPVGWFFTKTDMDMTLTWDGPTQQEQNYNQTMMRRVVKFIMPELWLHRVLIIDF